MQYQYRPTDMSPGKDYPLSRSSDGALVIRLDPIKDHLRHPLPPGLGLLKIKAKPHPHTLTMKQDRHLDQSNIQYTLLSAAHFIIIPFLGPSTFCFKLVQYHISASWKSHQGRNRQGQILPTATISWQRKISSSLDIYIRSVFRIPNSFFEL
jgi:hypothetical protein